MTLTEFVGPQLPWSAIIFHHSATKDGVTNDYEAIRRYHIEVKGWRDIGYHFLIERVGGKILTRKGRPLSWEGGHTVGWNKIAIGICVVGNYDLAAPDAEIMDAAVALGREIMAAFPAITPSRVFYHRQFASKTCPGTKFPELCDLRTRLSSGREAAA